MNPFTHFLTQWTTNRSLSQFISHWDRLERLTVLVHRQKLPLETAASDFAEVWPWLRQHYGAWRDSLRPYWQQTKAAGLPTQIDPFELVLELDSPQEIVGNWRVMQHLPAAREALNRYIHDQCA